MAEGEAVTLSSNMRLRAQPRPAIGVRAVPNTPCRRPPAKASAWVASATRGAAPKTSCGAPAHVHCSAGTPAVRSSCASISPSGRGGSIPTSTIVAGCNPCRSAFSTPSRRRSCRSCGERIVGADAYLMGGAMHQTNEDYRIKGAFFVRKRSRPGRMDAGRAYMER